MPDPGTATGDASVDIDMFLAEHDVDSMALARRSLVPAVCWDYCGLLEDGQEARAAETKGDGACSLHALWGEVRPDRHANLYYCEGAREKLCEAMPSAAAEVLNSPCAAAARALMNNMWADAVAYVMRTTQQEAALPGHYFFSVGSC